MCATFDDDDDDVGRSVDADHATDNNDAVRHWQPFSHRKSRIIAYSPDNVLLLLGADANRPAIQAHRRQYRQPH